MTNEYVMNGWDMIAVTKQGVLNQQLANLNPIAIKKTITKNVFGTPMTFIFDIAFRHLQISAKDGNGKQIDVYLTLSGYVDIGAPNEGYTSIDFLSDSLLTVTTQLTQIEADLQPNQGMKAYDLIIDFKSPNIILNLQLDFHTNSIPGSNSWDINSLLPVLKDLINSELGGQKFKVSSFDLSTLNLPKPLLPYKADFTFIKDNGNPDNSNLAILMLTTSAKPGELYFANPLLPYNKSAMVMVSNKILMENFVKPQIISQIKGYAKDPGSVNNAIVLEDLGNGMWGVRNQYHIDLNQDHDPWIDTVECKIDNQDLYFYMDVQDDATFLNIHVDTWVKSWQKFTVNSNQEIGLTEVNHDSGKSTDMSWWKWLVSFMLGFIPGLITSIIYGLVHANVPDLGGSFTSVSKNLVTWPNQQYANLVEVYSPGNLVLFVNLHFAPSSTGGSGNSSYAGAMGGGGGPLSGSGSNFNGATGKFMPKKQMMQ